MSNLEKLFEEWQKLQKSAMRHAEKAHKSKVEAFKSTLDDLFDIAHQDAMKNITEEDRQFLLLQIQKGMSWVHGRCQCKISSS